jgi:tripartite-type tricarboxylate transporter receptor subunit TctC
MAPSIRSVFAVLLAGLALACAPVAGAAWPEKPIRIIVPYAPGGGADLLARIVGQQLSTRLKQPVIVENEGGASNTIGMNNVKRADPDGYTFGLATPVFVVAPLGVKAKPYDPLADFVPVGMIGFTPLILVVHPSVPAKTLEEFIALARAKPGSLNFASLGAFTTQGLAATLFNQMAGIDAVGVPYKGSAPGVTDLLAGNVQYMFNALPSMLGHVRSGKLRALGVSSAKRSPELPDQAPILDTVPGYDVTTWYSLVAPRGTPDDVVARVNRELADILRQPEIVKQLHDRGLEPDPMSPADLGTLLRVESDKWAKVAATAHLPQQ